MSHPRKPPRHEKPSSFARASAKADLLLDAAFSQESPKQMARMGHRSKRLEDVKADLNAAQARVEALFGEPSMTANAIRRRINLDLLQDEEQPFTVMAGVRS
ncbi:hypothetical protein CBM2634_U80009 [Cupriavidus taiwanensis]|uniref:Uncharacterized protein n=1 Tax=Cupriavidus taiwanensis TaxID=164546 RepID=A0A375JHJ5_9BURK|nr:hypothetical protein CBM2634_U80009 [Cupriavidus taiwanensis]